MVAANSLNAGTLGFWIFVVAVALLPVGLGGNRPLPLGLAQLAFGVSAVCAVLSADLWKDLRFPLRLRLALSALGIAGLWAWLQSCGFMPAAWAHPIWQEAGNALHTDLAGRIAIDPEAAQAGLARYVTYISAGLLAYVFAQHTNDARKMVHALWIAGCIVCVYGLGMYALGLEYILWIPKSDYLGSLTATFINHNHFAIYAGMVLVAGFALTIQSFRDDMRGLSVSERAPALHHWLIKRGLWLVLLLILVLLSILFSHSRAGLVLSLAGVMAYIFFYCLYRQRIRLAFIAATIIGAVIASAFFMAGDYLDHFATLMSDPSSLDRLTVYGLMQTAIRDNPWLGYGMGGFQPVFRLYQSGMWQEFDRGHNDFLESVLELGLPAALTLWSGVTLLLSGLWHGILTRKHHGIYPCLGLTIGVMVLGHALVDFPLQIPGIAVYWAVFIGLGLAQSQSRHLNV